jgi:trimeric autotransporter adhesin
VGRQALKSNTTASNNTAVGYASLDANTTADNNTAVGYASLGANTTGVQNVALGATAGTAITTGFNNIAIGYLAMDAETTGSRAVAIGTNALGSQNGSGTNNYNVGIGYDAGGSVTTGTGNTFVGSLAGDGTDDGINNTSLGYSSLSANCGNDNTAIGNSALVACTGADNTAIGSVSGYEVTSGSNNTFLGHDAGRTGSPGGAITTASNEICLGDENVSSANIQVDWTIASDQRDKTDFTALDLGLDFVKALAPVTYKWDKRSKYGDKTAEGYDLNAQTPDGTHKEDWLDIGFKAQEVEALEIAAGYNKDNKTNLVSSHTDDGKQMGLQYSKFVPILVKAIQEQQTLIESLTARLEAVEGK